jgi:hypothetical protein
MSYLIFIAGFGVAVTYFLWLRDVRILFRTGLPGYRAAVHHGVAYALLALIGLNVALVWDEIVGLGIILLALYFQGREKREKVFSGEEPALDRFLGRTGRRKDKERG